MARDPVCGMNVADRDARATSQHGGKTYQFCSVGCKQKFDQRPEQYIKSA